MLPTPNNENAGCISMINCAVKLVCLYLFCFDAAQLLKHKTPIIL